MFKIEMHLHTRTTSKCGWLDAKEVFEAYREGGFAGVAVTDHMSRDTVAYRGIDLFDKAHAAEGFLEGARDLEALAKDGSRFRAYLATELRFDGSVNDFLVYGFSPDLLYDPDSIMREGLERFSRRCRDAEALIIQAHPFRQGCAPVPPELVDGIEVYNLNLTHNSHNDLALEYAHKHKLMMIAGSDCHRPNNVCQAGIICDTLPRDTFELVSLLRAGQYELYADEEGLETVRHANP